MITRILSDKIKQVTTQMPVITLTGPRQSGKTTLVQNLFPDYQYLNLEKMELRNFAQNDVNGFFQTYSGKLIIDEVQNVPELFSQIQVIVDQSKEKGKFILTGSQNFMLLQKITQSLAGRSAIFTLLPFSEEEIKQTDFAYNLK